MNEFAIYPIILSTLLILSCNDDDATTAPWYEQYPVVPVFESDVSGCRNCSFGCEDNNENDRYDYDYPVFNPNNGEEFAYLRQDNHEPGPRSEVWIMNGRTGETRMIADNALSYLDWSPHNELLFMGLDHQVYKVNSNGDNFQQMTFDGNWNRIPYWNFDGNSFTISRQTASDYIAIRFKKNGEVMDTIEDRRITPHPRGTNSKNQHSVMNLDDDNFSVGYFDRNTGETIIVHNEQIEEGTSSLYFSWGRTWKDEETILWGTRRFLGTTNIRTGEHRVILETAESHQNFQLGIHPNGTHALVHTITQELTGPCELDLQYGLHLVDLENGELRHITPPE